ncbi:hypothetical protein GCM10007857_52590 [Bradyrhizobium iriomotense]|uniref:Uncharacterized protein n=1 Tax=Bradyrhizobium iriomotense TaxID=441950 RepID=A0ABQ6B506_9BRAD|nr:hypothetical protein GCM10007857_52590 [Bradyrhizobium iriomotense]
MKVHGNLLRVGRYPNRAPPSRQRLRGVGRGGRCSLSLAARTLALSARAPSGTGIIGSGR